MSRCITLASILTFAACTRSPPPPSEPSWAAPNAAPAVTATPKPDPAPKSAPTQKPAITAKPKLDPTFVDAECRITRAGTCWGQPKKPRVVKTSPGAKP